MQVGVTPGPGKAPTPALVTVRISNHSKGALDLSVAQSWWKVCCDLFAAR